MSLPPFEIKKTSRIPLKGREVSRVATLIDRPTACPLEAEYRLPNASAYWVFSRRAPERIPDALSPVHTNHRLSLLLSIRTISFTAIY